MYEDLNADTEIHDHHHGNAALHVACTTKDKETVLEANNEVLNHSMTTLQR